MGRHRKRRTLSSGTITLFAGGLLMLVGILGGGGLLLLLGIVVGLVGLFLWYRGWRKHKRRLAWKDFKKQLPKQCNCARVYVGSYIGVGTNEFEREVNCGYEVLEGQVSVKRLRPTLVSQTISEGTLAKLDTLVLYPKTEFALVRAWTRDYLDFPGRRHNPRSVTLALEKLEDGTKSKIYRLRL